MVSIFEIESGEGLKMLRNPWGGVCDDSVVAGSKGSGASDGMDGDAVVACSKGSEDSDGMDGDSVVACTGDDKDLQGLFSSIVIDSLFNLMNLYEGVYLDKWVVMPNHIHFIIILDQFPRSKISDKPANLSGIIKSFKLHSQKRVVEATTASPQTQPDKSASSPKPSQPRSVQATTASPQTPPDEFQSLENATTASNSIKPDTSFSHNKIWHKSFYESIIRDEKHLFNVRRYIESNPKNWKKDKFHPKNQ
ncbi:MAG: hypothetical protein WCK98_02195 [bacterium]